MTPSRLVLAFSCVSLGVLLTRCGGDECKENCDALVGLTVIAPDQLAQSTCAPAQIVRLDGGATVRPTRDTRLALSGDASWFSDSACIVPATSATQEAGSRGAVAYLSARSAGRLRAQARGSDAGGEAVVEARDIGGAYTSIRVGGVRYADVGACVPIFIAAADSAGAPASVGGGVTVTLAAAGTSFFATEGCTQASNTVTLTAGHESAIAYARFGVPGEVTVTASIGGTGQGTATVDVEGDPQYRILITPAADTATVQAGECKPFALAIVDQLGAPLAVSGIDVAVRGLDASVFADAACATAPIATARVSGTTPTTVYVRANKVGSASFTASLSEAVSRTIQLQVSAAAASALRLGGPTRLSQNGCYPFAVERVDAFGNLVAGAAVVATVSSTLGMFSDSACTGATTTVNIAAGEAAGRFYVSGASLGTGVTIGATATDLTAASKLVDVIAAATAFRLELGTSTAVAGQCVSGKLYAVNGDGVNSDVLTAETVTIAPTPGGLVRYRDIDCSIIQSTATIGALGSQADFYVRSTAVNSYSVTTTGGTLTAAPARSLEVVPGPLAQTDVYGPDRMNLHGCTAIHADFYDQFANAVTLSNGRVLDATGGDLGALYDNPTCAGTPVTQIQASSGTSSATVWYRGSHLGFDAVAVGAADVNSGTAAFEVLLFMSDTRLPLSDLPFVKEVAVRPDGNVLFAHTLDGMVHRSINAGATWEPMCRTLASGGLDYPGMLFVSPAADGVAYVTDNYTNYSRVDDLAGGACPSIRQPFIRNIYGFYQSSAITVDQFGRLWAWDGNQLYYSDSFGGSWDLYYTHTAVSTSYTGYMTHHPTNSSVKLADFYAAAVGAGLHQSLNGGASFAATGAAGFNDPIYIARFDPVNAGYAYKRSLQSIDNGATWTANTGYNGLSMSWALDNAGGAYRFTGNGTTTVIERAPDARTPVWAALPDGTIGESFSDYVSQMSVSTNGGVIAVQTNGSIYLTTNAGTDFDRIGTPGSLDQRNPVVVVTSPTDAYAASGGNPVIIYATHDSGETWDRVGVYGEGATPLFHVNPSFPLAVYLRGEWFTGSYDPNVWATQDGFDNVNYDPAGSVQSYAAVGAISLHDPLVFYTLGDGLCRRTLDGGVSYEDHPCDVPNGWYTSGFGWVSPTSQDLVYFVGYDWSIGGPYLWTVDWSTGVRTRLLTPHYDWIAGIEMYDGPSGPVMRIADAWGRLQSSTDGGATFTPLTNGPFETFCFFGRVLTSVPGHAEIVASACQNNNVVAFSVDGGDNWATQAVSDCQIRQISLIEGVAVVSCSNKAPQTVEYGTLF